MVFRDPNAAKDSIASGSDRSEYGVTLWNSEHGFELGDVLKIKIHRYFHQNLMEILEGVVTEVDGAEITISGWTHFDIDRESSS